MGAKCCSNEGGAAEKSGQLEDKGRARWSEAGAFPPDSAVRVTILGAHDIAHGSWQSGQGPNGAYCVCEIPSKMGSKIRTPPASSSTRSPTWGFSELLQFYEFPDALLFTVLDADNGSPSRHLGKAQIFGSKLEEGNGIFEGSLLLAGVGGLDSTPRLDVKVEAVPRPKLINDIAAKEPQSLPSGRLLRMGISKRGKPSGILAKRGEGEEILVELISRDGAVAEYNMGVKVREQLQVGDCIVEANGMRKADRIVHELAVAWDDHLELVVLTRSVIFKVNYQRPPDAALGMELFYSQSGVSLTVGKVSKGAVQDYNNTVPVEKQVLPDDRILGVNGARTLNPIDRMEEVFSATGSVHLLIARSSGSPPPLQLVAQQEEDEEEKKKKEWRGQLVRMTIEKTFAHLGADIIKSKLPGLEGVIVEEIYLHTSAASHNHKAELRDQLHVGDRIVEVNGARDTDDVVREICTSDRLELIVEHRCDIFKVSVHKPERRPLGLDLHYTQDGETLNVGFLVEGAVQDYNQTVAESKQVQPKDHILAVNGERFRSPKERLEALENCSGDVDLLIRRVSAMPGDKEFNEKYADAGSVEMDEPLQEDGAARDKDDLIKAALMGFTGGSNETILKSVFVAWVQESRQQKRSRLTKAAA